MNYRSQKGFSFVGFGIILSIGIFFLVLTLKMYGPYLDNYNIDKSIESSILAQKKSEKFSKKNFESALSKSLAINRVDINFETDLEYRLREKPQAIVLSYERRVHLFYNIDVVMKFNKLYEL